jgi:hypothetical protein
MLRKARSPRSGERRRGDAIELVGGQYLASSVLPRVVPLERVSDVVVHPEVEICHHNNGGLELFRKVEGIGGHLKTFLGSGRKKQWVLGVAMRGEGSEQDVRLLGPRRHPRRRAGTLDVDKDGRHLGEIA